MSAQDTMGDEIDQRRKHIEELRREIEVERAVPRSSEEPANQTPQQMLESTASRPAVAVPKFKTPILSALYRFGGCIMVLAAIISFVGGQNMVNVATGLGLLFGALVLFGIAQVITAICETAFNTRRIRDTR